jgi:hypothetical protein
VLPPAQKQQQQQQHDVASQLDDDGVAALLNRVLIMHPADTDQLLHSLYSLQTMVPAQVKTTTTFTLLHAFAITCHGAHLGAS